MHAADVPLTIRFAGAAVLVAAWLVASTACVDGSDSKTDGGSAPSDAPANGDIAHADDASHDAGPIGDDGPTVSDVAVSDVASPDIASADVAVSDVAMDDDAPPCLPDPDAPVSCPMDLPPDDNCPDAAPSYAMEIAAIIARRCTVCHRPGGVGAAHQFDTYPKIAANSNKIHMVTQVYQCRMPPSCADQLTADERRNLLQWLVCGGPNN